MIRQSRTTVLGRIHNCISVFVPQAAGVIHRALCQLIRERRGRGVTLEAGSATANTAWAAQAATTAFLAIGVLERGAVNPVRVLATVIQPLDSVCTG